MGFKAGIYSSAGTMTCGRKIGSLGYEEVDAKSWANAGFDALKYDNCFNQGENGVRAPCPPNVDMNADCAACSFVHPSFCSRPRRVSTGTTR